VFIPLTINQRREGLLNVALVGDTAGIFWMLSQLMKYPLNVFLCDTGIKRPLRDFPSHRQTAKDRANIYYDFFDAKVGGGVLRRMDSVFLTEAKIDEYKWLLEALKVPTVGLKHEDKEVKFEDLVGLTIIGDELRVIRPVEPGEHVRESQTSAWDPVNETGARYIESGYPELEIIRSADGELVEFTGDLSRVFDGLF